MHRQFETICLHLIDWKSSEICSRVSSEKCWTIQRIVYVSFIVFWCINSAAYIFRRSILLIIVFVVCTFFFLWCSYCRLYFYNVIKTDFEFNWKMSDVLFCLNLEAKMDFTFVYNEKWWHFGIHFRLRSQNSPFSLRISFFGRPKMLNTTKWPCHMLINMRIVFKRRCNNKCSKI